ncbi:hypothetical protein J3R30DRAFT_3696445 [Lentinula aciculospora]|uniref:Uncharacterized protein n=1 Tax=Lentinula aciculospora TaxID=153920 RepID=A0A9W9AQR8_9AGAR|nr:hypothetical protein J3R30DRAFT_3696445 [Lentinula aciculospora]
MTTTRTHHALPAPVVHASFSVPQSKSHVLAGVQDAYWSDDEAEDAECPLCLEEMDISDLNFKPCVCGYQICRFCWHHIKENLNKRCPACRRVYTDEAVEFKPIATQDHKRLTQQKKQRERERKELDALGRRHLANVRVVQRNVVYVVGIGPRFAKEEYIPTLRSSEYFGQYGKINKIILVKRNSSGGGAPVVGVYITFHRREDAARAIAAVDGSTSPGGGREVMRASHGTTKYCMAFLRGVACGDHNCMNLHEWGDEKDCFTKEDLTTLKHTMKTTETKARNVIASKRGDEVDGLPRLAAWGSRTNLQPTSSATSIISGQRKRGSATTRQSRPQTEARSSTRTQDRKSTAKLASQEASSRPTTPASTLPLAHPSLPPKPPSPVNRKKKEPITRAPSPSPTPSAAGDLESTGSQENIPSSPEVLPQSARSNESSFPSNPSAPPGLPAVPPGLSAPPGLPAPPGLARPSQPSRVATASPQTPILAQQTSYQMSTAARALLDDVTSRRESLLPTVIAHSPFPDFDRTLENLSQVDGGLSGFSFNLDLNLAGDDSVHDEPLTDLEPESQTPFLGSFLDAFPSLRSSSSTPSSPYMSPPGIPYPHNPAHAIYDPRVGQRTTTPIETQNSSQPNYMGSFNPFADSADDSATAAPPIKSNPSNPIDDDSAPKVSRFGFARHGPRTATAASLPLQISSATSTSSIHETNRSTFGQNEHPHSPAVSQWSLHSRQEFGYSAPNSAVPSPMMPHVQPQPMYAPSQSRFHPFDSSGGVSEAQLRDFIQSSQDRPNMLRHDSQGQYKSSLPQFHDPAIMSAARFTPALETNFMHPVDMMYGPPPGLTFPPGLPNHTPVSMNDGNENTHELRAEPVSEGPSLSSPSDFPALSSTITSDLAAQNTPSPSTTMPGEQDLKLQEKEERKAAKKEAAAAKAVERQKIAQEKAVAKAAEKARIAAEKAIEKAQAAVLKAQLEKEKAERERLENENAKLEREKERLLRVERGRVTQIEREKAAQAEKGKMAKKAATTARVTDARKDTDKHTDGKRINVKEASSDIVTQVPLLSKKPKKNKPVTRPIRVPHKEDDFGTTDNSSYPFATVSDTAHAEAFKATSTTNSSNNSRAQSLERHMPTPLEDLMEDIHVMNPAMDLLKHPFFDLAKINPAAKMPLEYEPLVHALSALSVGGGSFAKNVPSGSIDNAVSSFQQLLETLTQTISDLLRLLPRTTWDDSSSFDGVLRDMLKGDDFFDETAAAASADDDGHGREDEVATLTLALERRARWMEVQLSKLEELHRDINNAAVRAVLAFNDSGWDRHGFMPRVGNTVRRFESIGIVGHGDGQRPMTAEELEKKLVVAKEAAVFVETELREMMENMPKVKPYDDEY